MIIVTGYFIAVVLGLISALHFLWAFGFVWPAKSEQGLVNATLGAPGATKMPPFWLTLCVAIAIFAAALIALWGAGGVSLPFPLWIRDIGMAVLALIFLIRGLISYLPISAFQDVLQLFKRLNFWFYSPLIMIIGIGYLVLLTTD